MGLFDFLKVKKKINEESLNPKSVADTTQIKRIEHNLEVASPSVNKTSKTTEIITDVDGNVYHVVKIGSQFWIVENLNVNHYRDGSIIPIEENGSKWSESKTGNCCYYDNNVENGKIYGKLYNWYAINDPHGLAPKGFHIPTDEEWLKLIKFIDTNFNEVGGKLKESGIDHWSSPNKGATNESCFSGLPGGFRSHLGWFNSLRATGQWWSNTEGKMMGAWTLSLGYDVSKIYRDTLAFRTGLSVRCVKD